MILPDVSVLVCAHRKDAQDHRAELDWLEDVVNADSAFGLSDLVVSGFLRVVTNPRAFLKRTPLAEAMQFADQLRRQPHRVAIMPGRDHRRIFRSLCDEAGAKGNLIPDAFLAAMAIEHGCEWITTDGDFARFPGLRRRHPLKS